ncbi:MAG TPA: TonB-dependent receptor [Polyangia bacterium]|nr:TonB-dependent receptor [Polyangia bacterium]
MRPLPFLRILAACACLATAAGAGATADPARGRLSGRVFERASAVPIAGALLRARTGESTVTDADGRFDLEVTAGEVELTIAAPGYESLHLTEKIPAHLLRTVEYRLLPQDVGARPRYQTIVHGRSAHEGERFVLREQELLQVPGAAGDPFRVIATLPGVIAPIPVLPIYVVRGGTPGMNGFFLDGMRVPQLFHLVFVDGIVHPRILERIDFYPGTYDVTFGRNASGVVDAATRPARTDARQHGEVELRLYDSSLLAEVRLPGGVQVLAAGRYGYPAPIIHLVDSRVDLSYWDYQLRVDWQGLTAEALGSYDSLTIAQLPTGRTNAAAQLLVEFHRLQLRERTRRGRLELETALVGGLDRMSIFSGEGVQKLALAARTGARLHLKSLTLFAGIDGELSRFSGENFQVDQPRAAPDELGELAGNRDGIVGGAYVQGTLSIPRLGGHPATLTAGVRADLYHAGAVTLLGVDPRVLFRYAPREQLEIFGGFGQYSQAPSFPVPLPGIDTFALQLGLQRTLEGSLGARVGLPRDLSVSATAYYGHFENINDVVLDYQGAACTSPPPESLSGVASYVTRQVSGDGYGLELLARRQVGRLTGWLAYTLSRAERLYSCGRAPSDFDQTHVLNGVVQARLPRRLLLGARFNLQTGRPYTRLQPDVATGTFSGSRNNERLPTYLQLDLRLDREWIYQRWALALFVEILNATYSESIYGVTFPKDPVLMVTRYDQPQFQGFRWVLPSIGVRGRF